MSRFSDFGSELTLLASYGCCFLASLCYECASEKFLSDRTGLNAVGL